MEYVELIRCACCGFKTLEGAFDICEVCFWQKDFFQEENIDDDQGPNRTSLRNARVNFPLLGAMAKDFMHLTRPPKESEISEPI